MTAEGRLFVSATEEGLSRTPTIDLPLPATRLHSEKDEHSFSLSKKEPSGYITGGLKDL